jgi:hypothetical protein
MSKTVYFPYYILTKKGIKPPWFYTLFCRTKINFRKKIPPMPLPVEDTISPNTPSTIISVTAIDKARNSSKEASIY